MSVVSEDQWLSDYKEVLTLTFEGAIERREAHERWAPESDSGEGEFRLERSEESVVEIRGFTSAKSPT